MIIRASCCKQATQSTLGLQYLPDSDRWVWYDKDRWPRYVKRCIHCNQKLPRIRHYDTHQALPWRNTESKGDSPWNSPS